MNFDSVKELTKQVLKHPTIIQGFFMTWVSIGLLITVSYFDFVKLERIVVKEFIGALLTAVVTTFGFLGAIIILGIQLADRTYDEQHRIAMDCWYRMLELSYGNTDESKTEKMWPELDKILKDAESRTKQTKEDEKYFKRFAKVLLAVFLYAIFFLIVSYAQLSSNASFPNVYTLSWFAVMMTFGAFLGFALLLLAILS